MDTRVEELISAIGKLREFSHSQDDLKQIKLILNRIFPDKDCANFIYTINTDKLPFGCIVFPVFRQNTISDFLITGEVKYVSDYEVEIDSKMFDYGLTDEEVVAVILFNIHNMTASLAPMENVREAIDDFFSDNGNQLIIRSSVQYQAILNLGLVDALNQVSSCLYLPDDVVSDAFLDDLGVDCFKAAIDKLYQQIPDCNNEASRLPKLTILNWALRLYDDVDKERIPALRLLDKVKSITASVLYINRINAAINALNRIDTDLFVSESVQQIFTEAKRRGGLIASLKYNGLRDIENDLYMFQLMAKNAETESEVLYALKQINARLAILDDYIRENPNDPEIDRWIAVKMEYIEIRDVLAKKKLRKRSYGIFVDYDALDKLDDESTNEAALNESSEESENVKRVKKDKAFLTKLANDSSEKAFVSFKEHMQEHVNSYEDERQKNAQQRDLDDFYNKNKKAPRVKEFDFTNSDIPNIILGGVYPHYDYTIFYQDEVCKYMRKSKEAKEKGYSFFTEDYPGIFCEI